MTGNVNYEPANHEHMVRTRAQKVANIARTIPDLEVEGDADGDLLVIGWGGTYGSIATAVQRARRKGRKVGQVHFRYLNPFPKNTADVLKRFKKFLVPELNSGQLLLLLRGNFLIDAEARSPIGGSVSLPDAIRPTDIFAFFGGGVQTTIAGHGAFIEARYTQGLRNVTEGEVLPNIPVPLQFKNSALQIVAGFSLFQ